MSRADDVIDAVLEEFGCLPENDPVFDSRTLAPVEPLIYNVKLKRPHGKQLPFVESKAKRKVIRAGRRGGKTTGIGIYAVKRFISSRRVLYAVPTSDQHQKFWFEVTEALAEPIEYGIFKVDKTMHVIEIAEEFRHRIPNWNKEARIRAKTAWNADTLRGDYADDLILDEWQLCNEDAWHVVGAPMLMDRNGDATFIYTPPSLASKSVSKATDRRHASKLYEAAEKNMKVDLAAGRQPTWEVFHFTSLDNPHLSRAGLDEVAKDLTELAYRQEILAEDMNELPGALWKRATLAKNRVTTFPDLWRIIVGVDPPGGSTNCGIVAAGVGKCSCLGVEEDHGFVLEDASTEAGDKPEVWSRTAVDTLKAWKADLIVAEKNFGGDMVRSTISTADSEAPYKDVHASRGKAVRAEPVAALYEKGKVHHVGNDIKFQDMEDEMCQWMPGLPGPSPNRMDALVWAITDLMVRPEYQPMSDGMVVSTPIHREFQPPLRWPTQY